MLAQSHLGFAESPVFIAHQAEYGQQLRLGELVFAETTPVGRQNHRGYIHSHASKRQESDFWHRTSCPIRKHHHRSLVLMQISLCAKDVNRATSSPLFRSLTKNRGGGGVINSLTKILLVLFGCALDDNFFWTSASYTAGGPIRGKSDPSGARIIVPLQWRRMRPTRLACGWRA